MRNPSILKQEFLKKWMVGLKACTSSNYNDMSIYERKKAIKLSADLAMASTRNGRTRWSRAIISGEENIITGRIKCHDRRVRSNEILRRSRRVIGKRVDVVKQNVAAKSIAKTLIEKRTNVLRGIVPGGEFMDEVSLIEETLDYISSLQAQVDVMRFLASATDLFNRKL